MAGAIVTTLAQDRAAVLSLPEGFLSCLVCGVAVQGQGAEREEVIVLGRVGYPHNPASRTILLEMARCPACTELRERAGALLDEHPRVARAIGSREIALHRVDVTLGALDAIGAGPKHVRSDKDLWTLLNAMAEPGTAARWVARFSPMMARGATPTTCSAARWGHVSPEVRGTLRDAYGTFLRAVTERPGHVRPPDGGGCLFCGVGSVEARPSRADEAWHRASALPSALGGQGPERLTGYLCPACERSVVAVGSIGPTAMERALLAHLGVGRRSPAAVNLAGLAAWCTLTPPPSEPNPTPWAHIGGLAALADELRTAG